MAVMTVLEGGQGAPLGQTHTSVTERDILDELAHRGYAMEVHTPVVVAPTAPQITKSIAIKVAVDEALEAGGVSRTSYHPFRCPSGRCSVQAYIWNALIPWCVKVANGYLAGTYSLPAWAKSMMHSGTLHGVALGGLGGFADWVKSNPWFVQSVGDTITNYGEHLTAQDVKAAIKANTDQSFTKDDALALVSALQQGGYVPAGKSGDVAAGASMAAQPSWMMPLLIGGGVLAVVLLMKK